MYKSEGWRVPEGLTVIEDMSNMEKEDLITI